MDSFVEQLKQLCASQPIRSKWVLVPGHAIGRSLGERIALEGRNWLNLRFVTPLDIALPMAGPFLVERGIDPSEEGLGPALMMRLLHDLPPEGGYFQPLADHPTMAQALWTTLRELRMAGVRSHNLSPKVFSSVAKHGELVALLVAYEGFLLEHNRGDMATVYEEALKHPDWCPIRLQDCRTELPDVNWSPLQRALIESLPGDRLRPRAYRLPGVSVPRRLAGQVTEQVSPDAATNPLAFLMSPACASMDALPNERIALFHAGGREAEVEEVFRRVLGNGIPLDQVEIACPSDSNAALIWEKALRHNWPITLGTGIPAGFTRPGRALLGLCDWIETDFSAGHFRRLLQSGDLYVHSEEEGFTTGQAARLLARSEAGWGRATYRISLGRLCTNYEARAADHDLSDEDRTDAQRKAEQAARVRDWITRLVTSVPEPGADKKVSLQTVVTGVLDFLKQATARSNALDHRGAAALDDYISELCALGSFSCGLPEALRFIRERIQSLQVAVERPRPGHLYACSLAQSGYAGRQHLFVVGLEEGRVFPSATEDAVLLDDERRAISPHLRLSTDRTDESVCAALARLAVSSTSVTFSYSCRDTREFRETYASWLVLQAFRLQRGNETLSYRDMKEALGEPRSAAPVTREAALSSSGWWLRSVVGTGEKGIDLVGSAFPDVARGRVADQQRQSLKFTEFDGYVPAAGPALDPSASENVFSVTELEKAADCPFRFFLKRALGVRPLDEGERDKDIWLDPLTRGSELHDLYAALLRRSRDENRPLTEEDRTWLISLAQERLKELHEEMPAATADVFERESKDFLADVELFYEAELRNTKSTPIGFEISFGRPLEDGEHEQLARPESVEIDLGKGVVFRIAGRIDRIDQVGPAAFEVLDYKTGGFWRDSWKGVFSGGTRLQHALYGLAAVELLKIRYTAPKVVAGVYYFSSHKGRQERVRISAPIRTAVADVLGDLRDLIIKGEFIRTPNPDNCTFCDYSAACGEKSNRQAEQKLHDSNLAEYRRLAAHA